MGVVPAFDELEEVQPGLLVSPVGASVDPLAVEGGEEALTHGIVVAVTNRAIEGRTPAWRHLTPNWMDVYCVPWSE